MTTDAVGWLIAAAIAAVFLHASSSKFFDARPLTSALTALGLPPRRAQVAARLVPFAEVLLAVSLVTAYSTLGAALLVATGAIMALAGGSALARSLTIHCACFGTAEGGSVLGWRQVVVGAAMLLFGLATLVGQPQFDAAVGDRAAVWIGVCVAALLANLVPNLGRLRRLVHDRRLLSVSFPS